MHEVSIPAGHDYSNRWAIQQCRYESALSLYALAPHQQAQSSRIALTAPRRSFKIYGSSTVSGIFFSPIVAIHVTRYRNCTVYFRETLVILLRVL